MADDNWRNRGSGAGTSSEEVAGADGGEGARSKKKKAAGSHDFNDPQNSTATTTAGRTNKRGSGNSRDLA